VLVPFAGAAAAGLAAAVEFFGLNKSPRLNLAGDADAEGLAIAAAPAFVWARFPFGEAAGDAAGLATAATPAFVWDFPFGEAAGDAAGLAAVAASACLRARFALGEVAGEAAAEGDAAVSAAEAFVSAFLCARFVGSFAGDSPGLGS
jgi:hypothetical protein